MAPEVANRQPYNEKVDIFSFGVILRLLLTGSADFPPPRLLLVAAEKKPTDAADGPYYSDDCTAAMQILMGTHFFYLSIGCCIYVGNVVVSVSYSSVSLLYQNNARPLTTFADPCARSFDAISKRRWQPWCDLPPYSTSFCVGVCIMAERSRTGFPKSFIMLHNPRTSNKRFWNRTELQQNKNRL